MNRRLWLVLGGILAVAVGGWVAVAAATHGLQLATAPFALIVVCWILVRPRIGLYLVLLLLAFVPPAPQAIGPIEMLYLAVFGATLGGWLLRRGWRRLPASSAYWPAVAILGLVAYSILPALTNETPLPLWFRGIVPFASLPLIFVAAALLRTPRHRAILVVMLYTTTLLLGSLSFAGALGSMGSAVSNSNPFLVRASLEAGAFQPIIVGTPMFALGCLVGKPKRRSWLHVLMLLLGLGLVALTFLRSALVVIGVASGLAFLIYLRSADTRRARRPLRVAAVLLVSALAVSALVLAQRQGVAELIVSGWQRRLDLVLAGGLVDETRILEANTVLSHFASSPIVGKGLGFQYHYMRLYGEWRGGYTHNIVTYFALTMGILGLLALFWFVVAVLLDLARRISGQRLLAREDHAFLAGTILYTVSLLVYALFQSVFRSPSFFVSLSLLIGAAASIIPGDGEVKCDQPVDTQPLRLYP